MQQFMGKRKDSHVYYHDGYLYHLNPRTTKKVRDQIFRCKDADKSGCRATRRVFQATLLINPNPAIPYQDHTCDSRDLDYPRRIAFKKALIDEASRCWDDLRDIFDRLSSDDGE